MEKIKYFTCFYHSILIFCSKRSQIKFNTLFDYGTDNGRELQNIAISHSTDIDYKDFMNIYRECTKEPFNFLTIDSTLPANNPLRFRQNLFESL